MFWLAVACFDVRVLVSFLLLFVHFIFSLVWVAKWPPFRKEMLSRLTMFFLYFDYL